MLEYIIIGLLVVIIILIIILLFRGNNNLVEIPKDRFKEVFLDLENEETKKEE